jgi:glycosyltransferase involved in cell wall biosynthesis
VKRVGVGPSFAKIPLNLLLTFAVLRRLVTTRYDVIHSHEEGGLIGVAAAAVFRLPHVYDMHSSLPQQLANFSFSRSRILVRLFQAIERLMIHGSRVVIVICPALEETVSHIDPARPVVVIENAPGSTEEPPTPDRVVAVRRSLGLSATVPIVLYTGTFESYQGLDLLFLAMAHVRRSRPDARLVLVGGRLDQVVTAREQARAAGVGDVTLFAGEQPADRIPAFLAACDVVVSPRSRGTNTPLKIYQYLRSERPIVATRLVMHTQVLTDDIARLTEASPRAFGDGILAALGDPAEARAMARRARELADARYSREAYLDRTRAAYAALVEGIPAVAPHAEPTAFTRGREGS